MFTFETIIRVCYADTDQMGYVYYGNYARYYEIGRVEALRSLGMNYKNLEASGVMMPVAEFRIKYLRPAYYDDLLTIHIMVKTPPDRRMVFDCEVRNESGKLLNAGTAVLAFVDKQTGKSCEAPEQLKALIAPFFDLPSGKQI